MGSTFRDTCYSTALEAASGMCASSYPIVGLDGSGGSVVASCTVVDAATLRVQSVAGAASSVALVPVSFAACDPLENYADLGVIFAVGVGCAAVIYITKLSFGFLWSNT
jgi:hypothetical protein